MSAHHIPVSYTHLDVYKRQAVKYVVFLSVTHLMSDDYGKNGTD